MEDKIIVHSAYYNPLEAQIVKTKLDDSNIPCFLTDEHISTIYPLYNQAVGGVKLHIFEKDIDNVNSLLEDAIEDVDNLQELKGGEHISCTQCGSTNVSYGQATKNRFSWWVTVLSFLLFIYPFKAKNCYHCYHCGNEF